MEQGVTFTPQPKHIRNDLHFRTADWLALLGTLICAAGYAFLHPSLISTGNLLLPGIGMTASVWLMLTICMGFIGWKNLHWSSQSIFLLISTLLLSATYGIFSNNVLRWMNLPVITGLFALTIYALRGSCPTLSASALKAIFLHVPCSIVQHLPVPLFALRSQLKSSNNRNMKELLLGMGICIPLISILVFLLCNADSIFNTIVKSMLQGLHQPNTGIIVWNMIRLLILSAILFAFVYGLKQDHSLDLKTHRMRSLPRLTIATVLAAICFVYAAFVYVQCRYLFAGTETVMMEGGYAEYARTGFFQLVAVAFVTLLIVLPCLIRLPESRLLRMLCSFVILLTVVIIISAFWRMRLYILKFGLTFLRCVTLWGILAIFAAMIAALVKAVRPQTRIFRALFVFTICTWLIFNYINVHARIVEYNVSAYRNGAIESLDISYLRLLGPESVSALAELRRENMLPVEETGKAIRYRSEILSKQPVPYDWSLSWLKAQS